MHCTLGSTFFNIINIDALKQITYEILFWRQHMKQHLKHILKVMFLRLSRISNQTQCSKF